MKKFDVHIYLDDTPAALLADLVAVQNSRPKEEGWAVSDETALLIDLLGADDVADALQEALENEMLFRFDLLEPKEEEADEEEADVV